MCSEIPGGCKTRGRKAADLYLDAPMLRSYAVPADTDADADTDTADSYVDDPLPPRARPPPPMLGEVPSGARCHQSEARGAIRVGRGASPSASAGVAAGCSGPPPLPASPTVVVKEAALAARRCVLQRPSTSAGVAAH